MSSPGTGGDCGIVVVSRDGARGGFGDGPLCLRNRCSAGTFTLENNGGWYRQLSLCCLSATQPCLSGAQITQGTGSKTHFLIVSWPLQPKGTCGGKWKKCKEVPGEGSEWDHLSSLNKKCLSLCIKGNSLILAWDESFIKNKIQLILRVCFSESELG